MTDEYTQELAKAIKDDNALEIHRKIDEYMNNLLELTVDSLEESLNDPLEDDDESLAVSSLEVAARSLGSDPDIIYDQGVFVAHFSKKQAVHDFVNWIDENCDSVDDYEISVYRTDAEGQVEDTEYEMDDLSDDTPLTFEVAVYLNPEIVWYYNEDDVSMDEGVKRIYKVNSLGKKRVKMQCSKGFKWDPERKTCVKITGSEIAQKRISVKQAIRTKKAMGAAFKVRMVRKTKKARRFRKSMGLK